MKLTDIVPAGEQVAVWNINNGVCRHRGELDPRFFEKLVYPVHVAYRDRHGRFLSLYRHNLSEYNLGARENHANDRTDLS